MPKRHKMTSKGSKKSFAKGTKVNVKNAPRGVMRGGIRL